MLKHLIAAAKAYIPRPIKDAVLTVRSIPRHLTARHRMLPRFIVFGSIRSGTSSIYHNITEHPQVLPALRKQVRFFDLNYFRGVDWYRAHFPTVYRDALARRRGVGRSVTGEASPEYIYHPLVPERIRETLPDVRLIAFLRDPVERAFSHYHHTRRTSEEPLSFEEAIDREEERITGEQDRMASEDGYHATAYQDHAYLAQGRYAEHLERWLECFPAEQMRIIRSEDFFAAPNETLLELSEFIGVGRWRPPNYEVFNRGQKSNMPDEIRERLTAYFAPHNRRLGRLLGRDFGWDN